MRNLESADHGKKRPERSRGDARSFGNRMRAVKEVDGRWTTNTVADSTTSGLSPTGYASQGSSRGVAEVPLYLEWPTISRSEQSHQSLLTTDSAFPLQDSRGGSSQSSEHTTIEDDPQDGLVPSTYATGNLHTMTDLERQQDPAMRSPYAALASLSEQEKTAEQAQILQKKRSGRADWLKKLPSLTQLKERRGKKGKERDEQLTFK